MKTWLRARQSVVAGESIAETAIGFNDVLVRVRYTGAKRSIKAVLALFEAEIRQLLRQSICAARRS
jgi:hypothetical protein